MPNPVTPVKPKYMRGALFSFGGVAAGVALWLIIWEMNFIASLAAYVMALLIIKLFRKGAGDVDRTGVYIILGMIVLGLLLSFYASFTADSLAYLMQHSKDAQDAGTVSLLTNSNFWSYNNQSLTNSQVLGQYTSSLIFAVVLAVWGVYSDVKTLFLGSAVKQTDDKKSAEQTE